MDDLTWEKLHEIGVVSPFKPIDEWLLAEQLDADACRMLRPAGHARHSGWAEEPIVLWRSVFVASVVGLGPDLASRSIADSLSLRCFCRIGLGVVPTPATLSSFSTHKQGALQSCYAACAGAWVATEYRVQPPDWYRLLDAWALRVIGAARHAAPATRPRAERSKPALKPAPPQG